MKRRYDPVFIKSLKKTDIRIRKSFRERIAVFAKNYLDPQLNNHKLRKPYKGLRSIDITNDYRAIYEEMTAEGDTVAYFMILGTHDQLYGVNKKFPDSDKV
ncbi:hypothetical protein HYT74_00040 [Candidatus Daviesbacteria bacterium]|nr:hypothetical protein [Candidatus Daviesbacteria bacterium]